MAKLVSKTYGEALFELAVEENKLDALMEDEIALNKQIAAEGIVLLKNDANKMPYSTDTTFSFVSHSSVPYIGGAKGDLKTAFEASGFGVNETLWNFYSEGNGKDYVRGVGSVSYGDDEDFSINECPLLSLIHI